MDLKKYFEKVIAEKQAKAKSIRKQIDESEDVKEVRALGETLQAVLDELNDAKKQLEEVEKDEQDEPAEPQAQPEEGRSLNPLKTMEMGTPKAEKRDSNPLNSIEYRKAFMNYCVKGTPIPTELREDATTTTTDAGAAIPTTLVNEIVKELKSYGNIYSQVRKLNVKGGVDIPILSLKPTATWITADTGTSESYKQKLVANTKVSFNYYGLECKVAQTLLTSVTTLDAFEALFTELATEAMIQAIEIAVIKGSGSGEPTGVTVDTRVPKGNVITLSSTDVTEWEQWKKKVFAKMKKSYRDGKFYMSQATFDGYIDGMVDGNGQPIGRVNYGIDAAETYRFGGKDVETVEDDVIAAYDDASAGDVIAVFFKPTDYGFNSNLEMQTVKWVDHDNNEIKNKVIMIADGKLIDPHGVLIIKKGQ